MPPIFNPPDPQVTPDILTGAISYFGGGVSYGAGPYTLSYVTGAYKISGSAPWGVQYNDNDAQIDGTHGFYVTDGAGNTALAPGNRIGYSTEANAEAGNAGQTSTFAHVGGPIGVYLLDGYYADNVAGTHTPTFSLSGAPVIALTATPTNGPCGIYTLTWSVGPDSSLITSVSIDQGIGSVDTSGSTSVRILSGSQTYTLTATSSVGTTTAQATISAATHTAATAASPSQTPNVIEATPTYFNASYVYPAGRYWLEYVEGGYSIGQTTDVQWNTGVDISDGGAFKLGFAGAYTGPTGAYYSGNFASLVAMVREGVPVSFAWGTAGPGHGIDATQAYSVRWTGVLNAAYSQTYTLSCTSFGGTRCVVHTPTGATTLWDNLSSSGAQTNSGSVSLIANATNTIRLEYNVAANSNSSVSLSWSSASQALQVIPAVTRVGSQPAGISGALYYLLAECEADWSATSQTFCFAGGQIGIYAAQPAVGTVFQGTQPAEGTPPATFRLAGPSPSAALSASSVSVASGAAVTLSWSAVGISASIDNGVGSLFSAASNTSGTKTVNPTSTTTYTLTSSADGFTDAAASVTVSVLPPTVDSFTASPSSLCAGATTTLSWATTGAASVSINNVTGLPGTGSITVTPTVLPVETYILTATNASGTATQSLLVTTNALAPTPVFTLTAKGTRVVVAWTDPGAGYGTLTANIYRGTSAGGETLVQSGVAVSDLAWTDSGLMSGSTYYYRVSFSNGCGESARAAEQSVTPVCCQGDYTASTTPATAFTPSSAPTSTATASAVPASTARASTPPTTTFTASTPPSGSYTPSDCPG